VLFSWAFAEGSGGTQKFQVIITFETQSPLTTNRVNHETMKPFNHETFMKNIRDLIARNELTQALQQLRTILDNSPLMDEAVLQAARFADIRKQIRQGLVGHEEANLTQNKIRAGLLELLGEMEAQLEPPTPVPKAAALRTELDAAISVLNSQNVVIGSTITAGGDVHIGDKTSTVQNAEKIYNIEKIGNANFS